MPIVEHVIIAVAGLGSRLGLGKPKCLVELEGHPIIEYQLNLLKNIPDIRVVIGFEEFEVINTIKKIRSDVTFIRNPAYRTTSTLYSYAVGAEYLNESSLFMDGDIIFDPDSFEQFINTCTNNSPLVGVTEAKTVDAVYAHCDNGQVTKFSRSENSDYEWANIVWVPPGYFQRENKAVFERLESELPLPMHHVVSYEVDTVEDYEQAKKHVYRLT